MGKRIADGVLDDVERNLARVRPPRPHTSIKYMEQDFCELFIRGLAGLEPDGTPDRRYRGRERARNAAMGDFVLSSGLRSQEFTHLTIYEVPPLPRCRSEATSPPSDFSNRPTSVATWVRPPSASRCPWPRSSKP
ncbi:hypothetical protein [Streptomyces lydicus]|uniref:hypothetical protein n=1 Tax=Streptomyces lydicus TaxID=47763 RepID=UPI0037BD09AE